jgi:hypothetical protein
LDPSPKICMDITILFRTAVELSQTWRVPTPAACSIRALDVDQDGSAVVPDK